MPVLENIKVSIGNASLFACTNRHYHINNIENCLKQLQVFAALFIAE